MVLSYPQINSDWKLKMCMYGQICYGGGGGGGGGGGFYNLVSYEQTSNNHD